jgi:hypothetical protein
MFHIKCFFYFDMLLFFLTFFTVICIYHACMLVGLHVKCVLFLSDLYLNWNVSDFKKAP